MINVIVLNDHVAKAWEAYTAAQQLAATTGKLEDGIAAGRAWRRWLSLFMDEEQKAFIGGKRASA